MVGALALYADEACLFSLSAATDNSDYSLALNRSRRTRKDKSQRFAALEKLKKAKDKGEKWKFEAS